MFRDVIRSTAFLDRVPDTIGRLISSYLNYQDDFSLPTTLMALLANRFTQEDCAVGAIKLWTGKRNCGDADYDHPEERPLKEFLIKRAVLRDVNSFCYTDGFSALQFIDLRLQQQLADKFDRDIIAAMKDYDPQFEYNQTASTFLKQNSVKAHIFVDRSSRRTLVFVRALDLKGWHLMQSLLPVMLPWWFEDKPLTPSETKLLSSLTRSTADDYLKCLKEIEKELDLRSAQIKEALKGFERVKTATRIAKLQRQIKDYYDDIENRYHQISSIYESCAVLNAELRGLEESQNKREDGELMEFFLCNKKLTLRQVQGTKITFEVDTTFDNYDADLYEQYSKNTASVLYDPRNDALYGEYLPEEGVRVFDAIFLNNKAKLKTASAFLLDFGACTFQYISNASPYDAVMNPHLYYYQCFGNNARYLQEAMHKGEYVMAITQCISIAGNINVAETPNMRRLIRDVFSAGDRKIIILNDGRELTIGEAVKYFKEEKNE